MSGNTGHNQDDSQQPVDVVNGATFDGVPYQIALDTIAFDHGWSANIRKGRMLGNDPLVVAVKVFGGMLDPVKEKLLIRELRFAGQVALSHPLILGFLGTANVGEQTAIVSLYMGNGNMMAYMKANPGCDKKKLILQVAEAVEFLHDNKELVHGDIKCSNVLISDFGDALLTDFGLSTFAEKSQFRTATMTAIRQMNTLHFAAPELLLGEGETTLSKTRQSDVYAFGMLIIEAISEQPPWGTMSDFAVIKAVCSGEHPDKGFWISHSWWKICRDCCHSDPRHRAPIRFVHSLMRDLAPVSRPRLLRSQERLHSAKYTPDGSTLIAVTEDDSIVRVDIATGNIRTLSRAFENPGWPKYITIAISPNGLHLACYYNRTVTVLDAASGVQVTSMSHVPYCPSTVAYSPDGARIASGASDGRIRLWDAVTGAAIEQELGEYTTGCDFRSLSFSPDGICIASVSRPQTSRATTICVWDSMECSQTETLLPRDWFIYSMEFSPDCTHIAAGDEDGRVFIWDVREQRTTQTFETKWGASHHVKFSPCGRYVASGFKYGQIGIWDIRDGNQVGGPLEGPFEQVTSVAFSPDGKSLASVADDGNVRIWNIFE